MFDDADYSIYGVCFYFLPNSRIRIGYGSASIEGATFPGSGRRTGTFPPG